MKIYGHDRSARTSVCNRSSGCRPESASDPFTLGGFASIPRDGRTRSYESTGGRITTTSDQESISDIVCRLVELYREAAQAAADTYHHAKQAAELFEIDPVHPEGFAALSTARAAEQRMKELDEPAASLEVRYRSDPRPEVPRFLDRMATERMFNALVNGGSGRGLGRGRRAASWPPGWRWVWTVTVRRCWQGSACRPGSGGRMLVWVGVARDRRPMRGG